MLVYYKMSKLHQSIVWKRFSSKLRNCKEITKTDAGQKTVPYALERDEEQYEWRTAPTGDFKSDSKRK